MKDIELDIIDTMIEKQIEFFVGDKAYYLYPITFGKLQYILRLRDALGFKSIHLQINSTLEVIRVVREKRDICLRILAYCTCKDKDEVSSSRFVDERVKAFDAEMDETDIATLLIYVFMNINNAQSYMHELGIDKEMERIKRINKVKAKNDKCSIDTGGVSMYGSFIIPLMGIGFTYNEIIWERSYTNLQLILSDKMGNIFLTEEERKQLPQTIFTRDSINADDPKNMEAIHNMDWK